MTVWAWHAVGRTHTMRPKRQSESVRGAVWRCRAIVTCASMCVSHHDCSVHRAPVLIKAPRRAYAKNAGSEVFSPWVFKHRPAWNSDATSADTKPPVPGPEPGLPAGAGHGVLLLERRRAKLQNRPGRGKIRKQRQSMDGLTAALGGSSEFGKVKGGGVFVPVLQSRRRAPKPPWSL